MTESASAYEVIYRNGLAAEAEWLQLGGTAKAESVDSLTAPLLRPFATLCEMGCGTGAVLEDCMRRGLARNYIGVDSSAEALEWLWDRQHHAVRLVQHDLEAGAPDLGTPVDLMVLSHVLEHLGKPQGLLASLHNKCSWLVAEVPLENQPLPRALAWIRSKILGRPRHHNLAGHVQFFSKRSFCRLMVSTGWTIVSERTYLAYSKAAILYGARRNGSPLWRSFAPYFAVKLLGRRAATRLFCVHYAVLATTE
jgi:2-polyprenyl-3-methyl-5-hydroxy-6-metoxy-1,4-benzoquinol methylase